MATEEPRVDQETTDSDELDHYFCDYCGDDIALCGADVTDRDLVDEDAELDLPCVVCQDLRYRNCPRCGVLP